MEKQNRGNAIHRNSDFSVENTAMASALGPFPPPRKSRLVSGILNSQWAKSFTGLPYAAKSFRQIPRLVFWRKVPQMLCGQDVVEAQEEQRVDPDKQRPTKETALEFCTELCPYMFVDYHGPLGDLIQQKQHNLHRTGHCRQDTNSV